MFKLFSRYQNSTVVDDRAERQQKLEQKRQQCLAEMGNKWVLHPDNKQQKLTKPRSF